MPKLTDNLKLLNVEFLYFFNIVKEQIESFNEEFADAVRAV